jgi:hypothetical protein
VCVCVCVCVCVNVCVCVLRTHSHIHTHCTHTHTHSLTHTHTQVADEGLDRRKPRESMFGRPAHAFPVHSTQTEKSVVDEHSARWTNICVQILGSVLPRLLGPAGADCFEASPSFRLWSAPGLLCTLVVALAGSATVCVLLPFSVVTSLAHAPSAQVCFLSCIFCSGLWFLV